MANQVNRWRHIDCQRSARAIARANRNKIVPNPGHAPYPLRSDRKGRDGYRRRVNPSTGACSDLIGVRLRRTVRKFLNQIVTAGTGYCPGRPAEFLIIPRPFPTFHLHISRLSYKD
jgi:hypothetical protein